MKTPTSKIENISSILNRADESKVKNNPKIRINQNNSKQKKKTFQKYGSVAMLPQVDPKLVLDNKGPKEWWEKYNFSNMVLFRLRTDLSHLERSNKSIKKKDQNQKPEMDNLYVPPSNPSSTSPQQ